jgi:hypothetical protein
MSAIACLAVLLGGISPALAEEANPFIGKWIATWENKGGRPLQADVSIVEAGGTWQTLVTRKNDPCVGKEAPIEIKSVSPKELRMAVRHSEVIPGCKDTNVKLHLHDDGSVTGNRGSDEMTFTKK